MGRKIVLRLLLAMTIAPWLHALPAQAQALRTFVSGVGKDSNPCTVAAPCQTLQAALAKTLAGGQISALDSADYGYVTINQAVSIISGHGATGVSATSSVTGITINAGANDVINLQGLDIDGAGSGADGIQFNTGASLNVQNSVIRGFSNGINFQPNGSSTLSVGNTLVSNNSTGIRFQSSATSTGVLNDVQLVNNGTGIAALGASSTGSASVTVQNSLVVNNGTIGILSGGFSAVMIANSTITGNGVGLEAQNAGAMLQVAGSTLTGNGTGILAANGGQLLSGRGNSIGGNSSGNSTPTTSSPPPPPPAQLLVSPSIYRANANPLNGATIDPVPQCVFLLPDATPGPITFTLDGGAFVHQEGIVPWDFNGTGDPVGLCIPYTFAPGPHRIDAQYQGGSVAASFTVSQPATGTTNYLIGDNGVDLVDSSGALLTAS